MAYRDGALGALDANGAPADVAVALPSSGQSPGDGGSLGPGAAGNGARTNGGTLGPGGAENGANTNGGTLGAGAAEGTGPAPESQGGPLMAYREGILGHPDCLPPPPGPLTAQYDGILGRPPYNYNWPVAGLGQTAGPANIVNLKNAQMLKEIKTAMSMATANVALTMEGMAYWDEWYYQEEFWSPKASELLLDWLDVYAELAGAQAVPAEQLAVASDKGTYPTPIAIGTMVAMGVGSPGMPGNPDYFRTNFPSLAAFMDAVIASGSNYGQFATNPPYFSPTELARGEEGGLQMSTVALMGLGLVGIGGIALVLMTSRKKKARTAKV